MPAPEQDLKLLEETVREAGHIARKFYGGDYKRWNKDGGSPVTEADLAVNKYLCDRLTTARPDYGWLSEENPDDPARLAKREVFVIDPIDGTIAFLKTARISPSVPPWWWRAGPVAAWSIIPSAKNFTPPAPARARIATVPSSM